MNPIRYETRTNIYNQNGDKVGSIDRLVIDPRTNEVTHIVVRKGFLFTKDKVIPYPCSLPGRSKRPNCAATSLIWTGYRTLRKFTTSMWTRKTNPPATEIAFSGTRRWCIVLGLPIRLSTVTRRNSRRMSNNRTCWRSQGANIAKGEIVVLAVGMPFNHAQSRWKLTATEVAICCNRVLASPV